MIGLSTALDNFGGIIATLLTGLLAVNSWRPPSIIYSSAIFVLFCVILYIPQIVPVETTSVKTTNSEDQSSITRYIPDILILNSIFYTIPSTTSMTIRTLALVQSLFCGSMMAIQNFCSFSTGILFKRISHLFGTNARYPGMTLMGIGFFLFSFNPTQVQLILSLILIGSEYGRLTPYYLLKISNQRSGHSRTTALSFASCSMSLGQFLNPSIISLFKKSMLPCTTSPVLPNIVSAILGVPTILVMFFLDHIERQTVQ